MSAQARFAWEPAIFQLFRIIAEAKKRTLWQLRVEWKRGAPEHRGAWGCSGGQGRAGQEIVSNGEFRVWEILRWAICCRFYLRSSCT